MAEIGAVIFDVFGTIFDWRTSIARAAAPFLAVHAPGRDAAAFADAWRALYVPAMRQVREGKRPFVKLDVLQRENLEQVLAGYRIDSTAVPASELEDLTLAWHRLDPWRDSVAGLARLKRRFMIAPHSNGHVRLMIDLARHAGIAWDAVLGAELSQTYKPDPQTYLDAARFLDLAPAQVCMAAAHNGDLAAARACGLATAFIARRTEYGPEQTTDLSPAEDWDYVADDVGELASLLGT